MYSKRYLLYVFVTRILILKHFNDTNCFDIAFSVGKACKTLEENNDFFSYTIQYK